MKQSSIRIVPMTKAHTIACSDIVASSEPWKSLRESVDFLPSIKRKQAFVAVIEGAVATPAKATFRVMAAESPS